MKERNIDSAFMTFHEVIAWWCEVYGVESMISIYKTPVCAEGNL